MLKVLQIQLLLLVLLAFTCCRGPQTDTAKATDAGISAETAPVTVYLLRHAEKEMANPNDQDPELSVQGHARAAAFKAMLNEVPVNALYVTKYKRTQQTLKPLADERHLQAQVYESNDLQSLKQRLLQKHEGQTVVIAGHSNTLLPLIAELGGKTKLSHIPDTEYNYIFRIVMQADKPTTVEVNQFSSLPN